MDTKHGAHWLERQDIGPLTVVRLKTPQELDEDTIRTVFDLISKLITDMGRQQLILNLAAVDFLPSMGVGKLVMLNRQTQAAKGRLVLCHLSASLQESLEHTHLTPLFQIYPTEQEAVASFG